MRITAWLFAVLLSLLGGVAGAETLSYTTYYHNDHLGSPVAATNAQGALLWRAHFRPYGERQEDPQSANYGSVGYTGHVQDADSGMVYAGARYYDPLIGRFMAIDPAPVAASAPGSFNRYLYANNNPYAYTDPDGELPFLVIAAVAFGGMMIHSDMANAPAVGETPQQLGTMDHLGALPGLNAGKAVTTLKAAGEVKDAVKVAKSGAESAKQAADLSRHLRYSEKYGQAGIKELENGRTRYYGDMQPASKSGEMAGRRYVHEFDPATGGSRGWHETLDHSGRVRQVRPEMNTGTKTHYKFGADGSHTGSW